MRSYYFAAKRTNDLAAHPTGYDRVYGAEDRADYHAPEGTDGIFALTEDACQVHIVEGTIVGVREGYANYKGYRCHVEGTETVTATESGYIALRWDNSESVRAFVLVCTPVLVDTATAHDIPLAQVTVGGGTITSLTDAREFVQWARLPAYYPPDTAAVPLSLWRYVLGLPMTEDEKAHIEQNPSLMDIYNHSRPVAASRYGVKFFARSSTDTRCYTGDMTDGTSATKVLDAEFAGELYDPLGILQPDKKSLVVPTSVSRLLISVEYDGGRMTASSAPRGGVEIKVNGTAVKYFTDDISADAAQYSTNFSHAAAIDVNDGDRVTVTLYGGLQKGLTSSSSGRVYAGAAYNLRLRVEVVE